MIFTKIRRVFPDPVTFKLVSTWSLSAKQRRHDPIQTFESRRGCQVITSRDVRGVVNLKNFRVLLLSCSAPLSLNSGYAPLVGYSFLWTVVRVVTTSTHH